MKYRLYLLLACLLLAGTEAFADIRLPGLFSNHMVLQRDKEVAVWGWADRKENVTIFFQGQEYSTQADRAGKWKISLPPTPAGGPHSISISGKNVITLNDVFFGDVYLASGQSNMEWQMHRLPEGTATAAQADAFNIRIFSANQQLAFNPQEEVKSSGWQLADSAAVMDFSAIAYYFARDIQQRSQVPVGIIGSYWGGTAIESWMSAEALDSLSGFSAELQNLRSSRKSAAEMQERYQADLQAWMHNALEKDPGFAQNWQKTELQDQAWNEMLLPANWKEAGLPEYEGAVWFRKDFILEKTSPKGLILHIPIVDRHDIVWINGKEVGRSFHYGQRAYHIPASHLKQGLNNLTIRVFDWQGQSGIMGNEQGLYLENGREKLTLRGYWKYKAGLKASEAPGRPTSPFDGETPTVRYNAMIAPIAPFAIKGILWYQGESNASRAHAYRSLFPIMIRDWRRLWKEEVPFLYVQLANFMQPPTRPVQSDWAELREAQAEALKLPMTAMATAIDLGEADDIHPVRKKEVAERLALLARDLIYKENLVSRGPVFKSMEILGNQIAITFDTQGSSLKAVDRYGYLRGFSIAREDRKFEFAKAYVQNDSTVIVYHDNILSPVAVRYAWADNPDDINLYNEAGLPAFPFRTDNWPLKSEDENKYSMK